MAWWQSRGRVEAHIDGATTRREHFDNWYREVSPDYLIVIKSKGWKDDRHLRRLLTRHFPKVARDKDYLVFDLRKGDHQSG
jgi:hypothetical protein